MDGLIEILQELRRSVDSVTVTVIDGQDHAAQERAQQAARFERVRRQVQALRAEQARQGGEIGGLANRVLVLESEDRRVGDLAERVGALEAERQEREEWTEIRAWIAEQRRPWWERLILWWRR